MTKKTEPTCILSGEVIITDEDWINFERCASITFNAEIRKIIKIHINEYYCNSCSDRYATRNVHLKEAIRTIHKHADRLYTELNKYDISLYATNEEWGSLHSSIKDANENNSFIYGLKYEHAVADIARRMLDNPEIRPEYVSILQAIELSVTSGENAYGPEYGWIQNMLGLLYCLTSSVENTIKNLETDDSPAATNKANVNMGASGDPYLSGFLLEMRNSYIKAGGEGVCSDEFARFCLEVAKVVCHKIEKDAGLGTGKYIATLTPKKIRDRIADMTNK